MRNTNSEIFVAGTDVGGNIGEKGEGGEEQEEHVGRMRGDVEKRGLVAR